MAKHKFNNIIDELSENYEYEYNCTKDGQFKRYDRLTGETETINSYADIVHFYLEQFQNKAYISGGDEYNHIIEKLRKEAKICEYVL